MARTKKNIEDEENVTVESALDELLNQFDEGVEICGRVYRITTPVDSVGKPSREAVGKVNEIVDEDYIGRTFGSGSYLIKYSLKDGTRTEYKSMTVHIGKEYDKFRTPKETAPAQAAAQIGGLDLGGILGSLTVEKLAVIGGLVKTVKEIFAPAQQPQVDMTRLMEIMLQNNKQQSVSDAVLVKCLDGMQKQNETPSILDQVTQFKAIKDAMKDEFDDNDDEKGDTMNFFLEKAFEYLPALLQKNKNDYQAVGREARDNPLVKSIINSDPELTKKFFEKAVESYGVEAANQLAAGFGYQVSQKAVQNVENLG